METYHPEFLGFEKALKSLRDRRSDPVETVARVPMPFVLETHIVRRTALGWGDSTARVAYTDLKAYEETYAAEDDTGEFEIS